MSAATSENRLSKTKIIATIGPASSSREKLKALVEAGVDVFRLNFAHGKHEWLHELVESIRSVSAELKQPIGLLADLSGPKIRLGTVPGDDFVCELGATIDFVRGEQTQEPGKLTCTYEQLIDDVRPGDRILMADGTVSLKVVECNPTAGWVRCVVNGPGRVRSRQGVNLPGVALSTPSLTDKDRDDLAWALAHDLDFIGLSFVRSGKDVRELREAITAAKPKVTPLIVSKIEKMEAIDDLDAILTETDAVMVARGDLGLELPLERVPRIQKDVTRRARALGMPVILATQVLESMRTETRPTRAEVSDAAFAVDSGVDAIMLAGETAIGQHPVRTVQVLDAIIRDAEAMPPASPGQQPDSVRLLGGHGRAICEAAVTLANRGEASAIVAITRGGKTARLLSALRPRAPIFAATDNAVMARQLTLAWGVIPVLCGSMQGDVSDEAYRIGQMLVDDGSIPKGSVIVLVSITPELARGSSNFLKLQRV